jgi:hypothetical protein
VIVVAGAYRHGGQKVMEALGRQTAAAVLETVVVDVATERFARLQPAPGARVAYLTRPSGTSYVDARLAGVRAASAPVVAFIEDHCFPDPDWAERLIEAHRGPWAAVGYGIRNANPETYVGRASGLIDYGPWANLEAAAGPTHALPGNNVSFKREALRAFEDQLADLLSPDQVIFEELHRQGMPMYLDAQVRVAHTSFIKLSFQLRANHAYGRLHAAKRARAFAWSRRRRLFYGLLAPLSSPVLRTLYFVRQARSRPELLTAFLEALPVAWSAFTWGAIGASAGYLFGAGASERILTELDLGSAKPKGEAAA